LRRRFRRKEVLDMDVVQIRNLKPRLDAYLGCFDDCFHRRDTREHLAVYVNGQLSDLAQKSVEPIALKAGLPPRTLQEFLARYRWDEDAVRQRLHTIVAGEHASPRSIGIIDETSDPKKGVKTPGVQRQHCGAVGKQDNCIVTVHLGYAVDDFHTLLDGELFLPESWSGDRERCREAGIPETMVYRPKTAIALELVDRAVGHGVHFEWLTFDEWYGAKPPFLRELDRREQQFVGEVHADYLAWTQPPRVTRRRYRRRGRGRSRQTPRVVAGSRRPLTVGAMMRYCRPLREQEWQRYRIKDGEKGPMVWEIKQIAIYPKNEDGLPEKTYHLIVARNVLAPGEIKYFVSNAPLGTPVTTLLLVAFSRWRVERCFEDEKGELGLDHYEGRKYQGLKRHLIITAVSHLFLAKVHQELRGEKPGTAGTERLSSADRNGSGGEEYVVFRAPECTVA
jgi:SRSO17 transposase